MCFFAKIDWSLYFKSDQWFYATVSGIIGTILGIGFSELRFGIFNFFKARRVRSNLKKCIARIKSQSNIALAKIGMVNFPNFSLDTAQLIRLIERAEGFISDDVLNSLDELRFQIEHINSKLQMLYFIAANDGNQRAAAHPECPSVVSHLNSLLGWCDQNSAKIV